MQDTLTPIVGKSILTVEQLDKFIRKRNPNAPENIVLIYKEEGEAEAIRWDLAVCQAILETGYFLFKNGMVLPEQNNFSGLGATNPKETYTVQKDDTVWSISKENYTTVEELKRVNKLTSDIISVGQVLRLPVPRGKGAWFKTPREGVRAQIQHLKGYATVDLPRHPIVDPRYMLLKTNGFLGAAKNWEQLGGRWATPGYDPTKYDSFAAAYEKKDTYGQHILKLYAMVQKEFPVISPVVKPVKKSKYFSDVPADHWAIDYIDKAQEMELLILEAPDKMRFSEEYAKAIALQVKSIQYVTSRIPQMAK